MSFSERSKQPRRKGSGLRLRLILLLSAGLLMTPNVLAQRNPLFDQAMNNYEHEIVECAAYFSVAAGLIMNTPGKEALSETYRELGSLLLARAVEIARQIDQKFEAVVARFELASKEMLRTLGGNAANSTLLNQYSDHCVMVSNDVEARGRYWVDQAAKQLNSATRK